MPVSRTSLPGVAVVAMLKRCRARRLKGAPAFLGGPFDCRPPRRGEDGRHGKQSQEGQPPGESTSTAPTVTANRRIEPHVENSDIYIWSSTKT